MHNIFIFSLVLLFLCVSICAAQTVDELSDVMVCVFGGHLDRDTLVSLALYFEPQFIKRGWFKYQSIPYNLFPERSWIADTAEARGAILEGGVQCANLVPRAGWPCPHSEDDTPPFSIPSVIYEDFATVNTDGMIYFVPNLSESSVTSHVSIANENWMSYCLWWAYEQIDAGVRSLEFDEISGAYRINFDTTVAPEDNSNDGYDDYALGTANICTRISLICRRDFPDSLEWHFPEPSASSNTDSVQNAFDDNFTTFWHSAAGDSHWLEINLKRPRRICQIYLAFPSAHPLADFGVQYWDGAMWQNFTPPISISGNTDLVRSFLVSCVWATKLRLFTTASEAYISEFQAFGCGFRQFILERFYGDSGWTPTDHRWETEMLVDFSDTGQCPDGTMNLFNYRKYLEYHNWTKNPFGCTPTVANALNPCNPFYLIWFPSKYRKIVFSYLPSLLDEIEDLYDASFSNYRTKELFWKPLVDSIQAYGSSVGRDIYLTYNGSYYCPDSAVDYFVFNIGKPPSYPAPSASDSQKTHLDARRVFVNSYRWLLKNSIEYVGRELPMIAFLDFGHTGFPFYHLGGKDEPADERAAYLRTYMAEAYASGLRFAVPLTGNEGYYIWLDSLSDGTSVGDIVKPITDFINRYGPEIYRNIFISPDESLVTVNGFVPYNGDTIAPSYANESKVAIAYTYGADGVRAYLHIINHNWDTVSHMMLPQESISVTVPVRDSCCSVMIISPDFSDTVYPAFDYSDSVVALTVPRLDYYNVVILDLVDATEVSDRGLELPDRSSISVYPNPFNSSCVIVVPAGARVKIYDLRGSVACELPPPKGRKRQRMREKYIWSPSESIPSGVYVVRVMVGDGEVVEKKVVLIK